MTDLNIVPIETDVLIIGGGLAGCMAAINAASEEGLKVTLVDKSNTISSGCAAQGIDHLWAYIPMIHEKMGYTLEDMGEDHRVGICHGFFRRDLFNLVAGTMYERILDLEKFGINFRYENSKAPGKFRIVPQFHSVPTSFNFDGAPLKSVMTREANKRGVKIINRVQGTDLITTEGQISGAVGVNVRTGEIYFFKAKAVVLSNGRSNRLTRNPKGFEFNTRLPSPMSGDGTSMAIRAGLPIINAEFLAGSQGLAACGDYGPNYGDPRNTTQPAARIIDGKGNVIVPRTHFYNWDNLGKEKWTEETRKKWLEERKKERAGRLITQEYHEGGGPFYLDFSEATDFEKEYIEWSIKNEGRGTQFMRYFLEEEGLDLKENPQEYTNFSNREISSWAAKGLWVDKDLETEILNLFGAGDEVGGLPWQSGPGAVSQGWHAGGMAAKRAKEQTSLLSVSDKKAKERQAICSKILNREVGFHWKDVEIGVQNLMDFYCGEKRTEAILSRGIERLEDAKQAPLKAENPHELGRCLDVRSIIDNAEIIMRSSLERTESRVLPFGFKRADYPEPDDKNWRCFLGIRKEKDDTFRFSKYNLES
ncbi:FAD-dependent oxidoreductase [Thermodesulfobacteriota bacterium]